MLQQQQSAPAEEEQPTEGDRLEELPEGSNEQGTDEENQAMMDQQLANMQNEQDLANQ